MFDPEFVKTIHIISAIVLFGTGMGTAFHGFMCNISGNKDAMHIGNRNVVLADWIFTTPAVIIQPVTGIYLMWVYGWSFTDTWIILSFVLYGFAGLCWLPVVWIQVQMHKMTKIAITTGADVPEKYQKYFKIWFALGWPAFIAGGVILWLMVNKPF